MVEVIVDRCGQSCPFFEADDRIICQKPRCFLDPTLSIWRYCRKPQEKGSLPKNCPMKRRKQVTVIFKE